MQALAAAGALVALSEGRVETVERGEWVNFVDSQRIAPAMSRHDSKVRLCISLRLRASSISRRLLVGVPVGTVM